MKAKEVNFAWCANDPDDSKTISLGLQRDDSTLVEIDANWRTYDNLSGDIKYTYSNGTVVHAVVGHLQSIVPLDEDQ